MSLRRTSRTLGVSLNTIIAKQGFLASQAKRERIETLNNWTGHLVKELQFDELITCEHTLLKPVSVIMAVEPKSRIILNFKVISIRNNHPVRNKISDKRYGKRKDERVGGLHDLLRKMKPIVEPKAEIRTDQAPYYPSVVERYFPRASHLTFKSKRASVVGQGELKEKGYDPLFYINHQFAQLRDSISRLNRRSWNISKLRERLEEHIEIYISVHNQLMNRRAEALGYTKY